MNHEKYWKNRKIDWEKDYFNTWNHPHRKLIIEKLRNINFRSLVEIGCGAGENLYIIKNLFKGVDIGGIDINKDAIETAKRLLPNIALLEVGKADDLFMNDKSTDILLTDMCLIYVNKNKIKKVFSEIKRVTRNYVILVEFHHKSLLKRLGLKLASNYNAYDYERLLEDNGFYNIEIEKIKEEDWPKGEPQKTFGYIISAKIP